MSVAAHLGIDLREYDARIRTFIPDYDTMLSVAAASLRAIVGTRRPLIVDFGIGSGALAAACLAELPRARVIGIDEDEGMLAAARTRLGGRLKGIEHGSFERVALPRCDAAVASLALHHVPTRPRRLRLLRRLHSALRPGGVLITADCYPASQPPLAVRDRAAWIAHLEASYPPAVARRYLRSWAREDHYVALATESSTLEHTGFTVDVRFRRGAFAVIAATK
jgi:SAM-dependent methyltransferase